MQLVCEPSDITKWHQHYRKVHTVAMTASTALQASHASCAALAAELGDTYDNHTCPDTCIHLQKPPHSSLRSMPAPQQSLQPWYQPGNKQSVWEALHHTGLAHPPVKAANCPGAKAHHTSTCWHLQASPGNLTPYLHKPHNTCKQARAAGSQHSNLDWRNQLSCVHPNTSRRRFAEHATAWEYCEHARHKALHV